MKTKFVTMLTITILLLGAFAAIPVRSTLPTAVYVDPASFVFQSDTIHAGYNFTVSIIADVVSPDAFYGWELVLRWTPGLFNATKEVLNMAIWEAVMAPWVDPPIDNVAGTYHQSVTAKSPATTKTGLFWLTNITFTIVEEPGYGETLVSDLHLELAAGYTVGVLLDDASPTPNEIVHSWGHGTYEYSWAPPTDFPHLEVSPETNTFGGKNIYKTPFGFSVDILIKDVSAGWELAGVELLLLYNTTVLDTLGVTEGTFFDPFTDTTFFQADILEAQGKIRIVYTILNIVNMTAPHGDGLIATINFNCTYQEKFPSYVESDLDIQIDFENGMTGYFINKYADEIEDPTPPPPPEVDGYYRLNGYVVGKVIDLYTQYPDPYGGQGPGEPSDMFWPQKEVELYAYVTYNEWPVQQKLVGFEVRGPHNELVDILTAVSDYYGVAHTTYRIPWPCDNPESWFGVWTITATVDIACDVVNDTLQFHFDYLVHWYGGDPYKVTTDKADYGHCEFINVTVTFGSHSRMPRWVLLTVSIHDELNYAIGTAAVWIQVGGTVFCQLKNYTETLPIHVVKWTAAGVATIYVNAYSDWPTWGGSPWAPTFAPAPTVNILPKWA
jgi:hypothetical protein